jgi:hypothetical protein
LKQAWEYMLFAPMLSIDQAGKKVQFPVSPRKRYFYTFNYVLPENKTTE